MKRKGKFQGHPRSCDIPNRKDNERVLEHLYVVDEIRERKANAPGRPRRVLDGPLDSYSDSTLMENLTMCYLLYTAVQCSFGILQLTRPTFLSLLQGLAWPRLGYGISRTKTFH